MFIKFNFALAIKYVIFFCELILKLLILQSALYLQYYAIE